MTLQVLSKRSEETIFVTCKNSTNYVNKPFLRDKRDVYSALQTPVFCGKRNVYFPVGDWANYANTQAIFRDRLNL